MTNIERKEKEIGLEFWFYKAFYGIDITPPRVCPSCGCNEVNYEERVCQDCELAKDRF